MKNLIILLSLVFALSTGLANAHVEHDEKPPIITESQALNIAALHVKNLVRTGKLDKSWEVIAANDAIFERRNSRFNWIVSFVDSTQEDDANKTLFVFLTNTGYFLSTNFTGK